MVDRPASRRRGSRPNAAIGSRSSNGPASLGGQFRLAGLQPSRGQITDLIAWYGRQLEQLGVDVRLGVDLDGGRRRGGRAPTRSSSRPDRGRPGPGSSAPGRWWTGCPGSDDPSVTSIQAVLAGAADVGPRVLVLDDLGDWRGLGTALHLVEAGHEVTILTSARGRGRRPVPQRGRRAAPPAVRPGRRPDRSPSAAVVEWRPGAATIESTLTGATSEIEADTLVIAETPVAVTDLAEALTAAGIAFHAVGDCVAPRRASLAFHDARALARRL